MPSWNDSKQCPVCGFEGDLGPSDHYTSCSAFMRGAVALEGEQQLPFDELEYPNTETKQRGDYVENVHPCATYSDGGVVIQAEKGYDQITVQYGRGSTCFGPAANWRVVTRKPEWLRRLELEQLAERIEAGELLSDKSMSDREFLAPLLGPEGR